MIVSITNYDIKKKKKKIKRGRGGVGFSLNAPPASLLVEDLLHTQYLAHEDFAASGIPNACYQADAANI